MWRDRAKTATTPTYVGRISSDHLLAEVFKLCLTNTVFPQNGDEAADCRKAIFRQALLLRDSRHLGKSRMAASYTDAKIEVEGLGGDWGGGGAESLRR